MPPATSQPKKPDPSAAAKERNEYIPSFIAKKPFYVPDTEGDAGDDSNSTDYLEHQRLQRQEDESIAKAQWYDRGKKLGPAATKYRKGACENCGSMSHKTKDCLQRKRKAGAKWTGRDIAADERVQDLGRMGWDAKRDRWNGYDANEYQAVVEEYDELERIKKATDGEQGELEGAKYEEETDMGREQSTSTRNLRIREDTAKYLLNLDLDSAKYDPKTRSMVDSGQFKDAAAALVAEEGFVKKGGDAAEFERAQQYAWETQERGDQNKIHLQANPTAGEVIRKQQEKEKAEKKAAHQKSLAEKYGSQEKFSNKAMKDLAITENERYVEYDETGHIKGLPKVRPKSKYAEDVYPQNHTSVWGSWWNNFQWGYACCFSTTKMSYCTGEAGKAAFTEEARRKAGGDLIDQENAGLTANQEASNIVARSIAWRDEAEHEKHVPNGVDDDARKAKADDSTERRKRTLDEMRNGVTEEEMEEYRRKRVNAADPMAKMLSA